MILGAALERDSREKGAALRVPKVTLTRTFHLLKEQRAMDNERARASENLVPSAAIEINLSARPREREMQIT